MAGFGAASGGEWRSRISVWAASRGPVSAGFTVAPQPRSLGLVVRGRHLVAGTYQFGGHSVEAPGEGLWDIAPPDARFAAEVQGFAWLDDLAALGCADARARAQDWTQGWIARFGAGRGPGWSPDLTGRRVMRWIYHAPFLLTGADRAATDAYYRALSVQTRYLARNWPRAAPGLPRFEALTALVCAALSLTGMGALAGRAVAALSEEAARQIDADGGILSRNPEDLLEVFTHLTWAALALSDAGRPVAPDIQAAVERVAPTLRALRHADGGLARFHGGGRGIEGRLDHALADCGVKPGLVRGLAMGYARLSAGRTTLIMDVAAPPAGLAGALAHASTLGFELTSGRRPLIVNCGSGAPFGVDWRRAGRATPSHSTLAIEGVSSSRFGLGAGDVLSDRAAVLTVRQMTTEAGKGVHAAHDGWATTHGLSHARDVVLSGDGRTLTGVDTLIALNPQGKARFAQAVTAASPDGVPFSIRFHLHSDANARLVTGGNTVSVALKSGEIWQFCHDGIGHLSLEPSVYLEKGRLRPRPTRQIVLSGHAATGEVCIGWTLAKAQDTPLAIRDLACDEKVSAPTP
jgi:uncharacterized heparinase superfamily protein